MKPGDIVKFKKVPEFHDTFGIVQTSVMRGVGPEWWVWVYHPRLIWKKNKKRRTCWHETDLTIVTIKDLNLTKFELVMYGIEV